MDYSNQYAQDHYCDDDEFMYQSSKNDYGCEPIHVNLPDFDIKEPNELDFQRKRFIWEFTDAALLLKSAIKLLPIDNQLRQKVKRLSKKIKSSPSIHLCSVIQKYKPRNVNTTGKEFVDFEQHNNDQTTMSDTNYTCEDTSEEGKFLDSLIELNRKNKKEKKDKKLSRKIKLQKEEVNLPTFEVDSSSTSTSIEKSDEQVKNVSRTNNGPDRLVESNTEMEAINSLLNSPKHKLIEYKKEELKANEKAEAENDNTTKSDAEILYQNRPIDDISILSPPKVDHGVDEVQKSISEGIVNVGIEVFPTLIDESLAVIPSLVNDFSISPFTVPDGKKIIKTKLPNPNSEFSKRIAGRWAQVLVKKATESNALPKFDIPSREYEAWISQEYKKHPIPDAVTVLLDYYTTIKGLAVQSDAFMKNVSLDYKRLYNDTRSEFGTIPFIPSKYFADTKEGDKAWKKYMASFGYLVEDEKSKVEYEKNLKTLQIEVYKIIEQRDGKYKTINEANGAWDKVLKMEPLDLVKIKVQHQARDVGTLARDIPRTVARNVDKLVGDYNPTIVKSMTLLDFSEDKQEPTMEEKAQYHEYVRKRNKQVEDYNKKNLKNKRLNSPTSLYFNYVGINKT
jgi:hypothetical protein